MEEQHIELKRTYAANLLRFPDDPFKAAFSSTPDSSLALQLANKWQDDPIVKAEMEKLLNGNEARTFLPSKEQQARDIYRMATSEKVDTEDRLKAHRLYAEVMGFIEKPVAGATTNILNQGVMIVKDQGSDLDWQKRAAEQQRTLTGHVN